jgi:uncharacterized membrane protein YtjA (UPF0391 family)
LSQLQNPAGSISCGTPSGVIRLAWTLLNSQGARRWRRDATRGFSNRNLEETTMLQAAAVFFVIAIIAAIFGFGGIAAGATEIAKILFFLFLIVFIVSLIMGLMRR